MVRPWRMFLWTAMGEISMDDGIITVEGAEACQGEPTIEDGSVGNGIIDAGGAQSHGAERVSDAQGAQLVGSEEATRRK